MQFLCCSFICIAAVQLLICFCSIISLLCTFHAVGVLFICCRAPFRLLLFCLCTDKQLLLCFCSIISLLCSFDAVHVSLICCRAPFSLLLFYLCTDAYPAAFIMFLFY